MMNQLQIACVLSLILVASSSPFAFRRFYNVKNVICPDGESECPDGNTCCQLSSGKWGCCPLPNAVCCSDHIHCCPNGYTCDVPQGTCTRKGDTSIPMVKKEPAKKVENVKSVTCPGGQSECPNGNTCCKLSSGQYGCCPLPNAVCCSDHIHCCPNGYTCDVSQGTCNREGDTSIPMVKKEPAKKVEDVKSVICPDEKSKCPDGNTCCELSSGQYGCCPLPKAVCCSDHLHCCPNGYTCDVAAGKCLKGTMAVPMVKKEPAKKVENVKSVICPDEKSKCPDGNTCCELSSGQYGCCPLPKAVCCSDHLHCCPNGYTCDVAAGKCLKGTMAVPMVKKEPAKKVENVKSVICPDEKSECPDGNTCCELSSGKWGCCPLPKAVCCSDHLHCCPNGYTCDVPAGKCLKGTMTTPLFLKNSAGRREI